MRFVTWIVFWDCYVHVCVGLGSEHFQMVRYATVFARSSEELCSVVVMWIASFWFGLWVKNYDLRFG